jgi:hypothetical protein
VIAGDEDDASETLSDMLIMAHEPWQLKSTADNLELICMKRERQGEDVGRIQALVDTLRKRAGPENKAG